jgi:hypothetical protein
VNVTVTRNGVLLSDAAGSRAAPEAKPGAATISAWGVKAAVGVALVACGAQLLDFAVLDVRWLDMNTHASVFGALSLLALALAAAEAALLAASQTARTRASLLLPMLLAALLILRLIHPANVIFLALPCAAATFVILWGHNGAPRSEAERLIRLGCVALVGSYVVHAGRVLLSASGYGRHTWPTEARLLVGHSAELAGWMLVAAGLAAVYASVRRTS